MAARKIIGLFLAAVVMTAGAALADDDIKQKLTGGWEMTGEDDLNTRQVITLDFEKGVFEETYSYNDDYYLEMMKTNPEYTRQVLPLKTAGSFMIVSEGPDHVVCDFFYDHEVEMTLDHQEADSLKIIWGMALRGRAEAVENEDYFVAYLPWKDNHGFDGFWVTEEKDSAVIIRQNQRPAPELSMFAPRADQDELDRDENGFFAGIRTDGDLTILSTNEGLTAARFDNWRSRDTLSLKADGTLAVSNGEVYKKIAGDK